MYSHPSIIILFFAGYEQAKRQQETVDQRNTAPRGLSAKRQAGLRTCK